MSTTKPKWAQTKAKPAQTNPSEHQWAWAKAKQVQSGSRNKYNQAGTSTTEWTQMGRDKQGPANKWRWAYSERHEQAVICMRTGQCNQVGQTGTSKRTEMSTNKQVAVSMNGGQPNQHNQVWINKQGPAKEWRWAQKSSSEYEWGLVGPMRANQYNQGWINGQGHAQWACT